MEFQEGEKAIENQGVDYLQIRNQHKDKNFGPYTKGYYPKFLGVMYVATHEEEFFGKIVDSANKGDTKLLKLRIKAKPQLFTQKIPFSIQELKMLPWNMRYTDYVWSGRQFIPWVNLLNYLILQTTYLRKPWNCH